jgi:hypothetical protein
MREFVFWINKYSDIDELEVEVELEFKIEIEMSFATYSDVFTLEPASLSRQDCSTNFITLTLLTKKHLNKGAFQVPSKSINLV